MIKLVEENNYDYLDKQGISSMLKSIFSKSGCAVPKINFLKRSIILIFRVGMRKHPVSSNDKQYIVDVLEANNFDVLESYTTTGIGGPRGWGDTDVRISIANPLYSHIAYDDESRDLISEVDSICGTYKGVLIEERNRGFAYIVPIKKSNDGYIASMIYKDRYTYRMDDFEEYEQYCNRVTKDISISWLLKRIVKPIEVLSASEMESLYYNNRGML